MAWNYRVVRHVEAGGGEFFRIHEVYYEKGKPYTITEECCSPGGESPDALREDLEMMQEAFALPVLNFDDF